MECKIAYFFFNFVYTVCFEAQKETTHNNFLMSICVNTLLNKMCHFTTPNK